jgi:hypothetical protein
MNYIVIGDGSRCLTGAFLSFFTKGNVWSIDPSIRMPIIRDWMDKHSVLRFNPIPSKFEDVQIKDITGDPVTIVLVHAHVSTYKVIQKFTNWRFLYVNPCCLPETQLLSMSYQNKFGIQCIYAGIDDNITSPKNSIFIYHNNSRFPKDRIQAA